MFGLFRKKDPGNGIGEESSRKELKKRLYQLKSKRINCVHEDMGEFLAKQRLDSSALLGLTPVNYYAIKDRYIEAHYFYSEDYSECYVTFTDYDSDKAVRASEIFPIPTEILVKAFAKVGIIVKLPEDVSAKKEN